MSECRFAAFQAVDSLLNDLQLQVARPFNQHLIS